MENEEYIKKALCIIGKPYYEKKINYVSCLELDVMNYKEY